MNHENERKIESMLPPHASVIDVGGGQAAVSRADWVIDMIPFEQQGRLIRKQERPRTVCFNKDRWVQMDLCSRQSWPFEDKQFDFAICSHVLEDVRDPIWICSEMCRIAKAGYIEVPSRFIEQTRGIEHPRLAGYHHHRWLVSIEKDKLQFRHKPHLIHVTREAIVASVGFRRTINPRHQIDYLFWENEFAFEEVLEFEEDKVVRELCDWSRSARRMPDLLVRSEEPFGRRLRRLIYFWKLRITWG